MKTEKHTSKLTSQQKFNLQVVARLFYPSLSDAMLFSQYDTNPDFRKHMSELLKSCGF